MAGELLFVTASDDARVEGFSYTLELAKVLGKEISVLLIEHTKRFAAYINRVAAAVTFAEADEHEIARELMQKQEIQEGADGDGYKSIISACIQKKVNVTIGRSEETNIISAVCSYIKTHNKVDMVILAPDIVRSFNIRAASLKRLARVVPQPIVAMSSLSPSEKNS